MEDIFTDSQIPEHSLIDLRKLFFLCFFLGSLVLSAQKYSTSSGKAIKLFEKGEQAVIDRNFETAIALFESAIKKDNSFREAYLKLATIYSLYRDQESSLKYYQGYSEVTPKEKVSWGIWKNLAYLNFSFGHYELADQAMTQLLNLKPDLSNDPNIKLLAESIEFSLEAIKNQDDLVLNELPASVNRFALQYFPVLAVDGRTLLYTKRDANHPGADEDIVFSVRSDSGWSEGESISPMINTDLNEGACSISADGRTLVFTSCDDGRTIGSCDLFMCTREGNEWSEPRNMGEVVNSKHWDSQPSLSADGRKIYFSSNRPGGFGNRDLWVTTLNGTNWSQPVNMGSTINGWKDETTPFIHANNNILLFSSNSYPSLGGYDLFFSKKENNVWSQPVNLGYPINSYKDEVSLFIAPDGTEAYYSKERMERGMVVESKIVNFKIESDTFEVSKVSYVTGLVRDEETKAPLGARLRLLNLSDSTDEYLAFSDPASGSYFIALTAGVEYGVFVDREKYLFENLSFESRSNELLRPDTVNVDLKPIKPGSSVVLKNIYFEFDRYKLSDKSRLELESIVKFLESNPEVQFQIEGHTDSQGEDDYNVRLSLQRAESVFNYLKSRGISPKRMVAKGFGSSRPLQAGESEEVYRINRRITFRVLK
ncbi:OmpA family protein [Marinoscillum sp. MHG1-6]|uniref:OmpA family protein n=1 Tax=Marinoscillum sp. MHG1-6 TaxID=2959627 RepID=UPI002157717F|nr:OmpA family protein [Marinoscillum sp. MHG1-6]